MTPARIELATTVRRIPMRDVDSAGVVYLAAPYAWVEEMWTSVLYEAGHPVSQQFAEGFGGPVVSSSATYLSQVRGDFILECRLYADHVGNRSFGLHMDAHLPDGSLALTVATRHVWCRRRDQEYEPEPLPAWLRALLSGEG